MKQKKLDLSKLSELELKDDEMKKIKAGDVTFWVHESQGGSDWHWGGGYYTLNYEGAYC